MKDTNKKTDELVELVESLFGITISPCDDLYLVGLDSLDYIELIMEIEKKYRISIPDDAIEKEDLTTIEKIVLYITKEYGN
jgi:acyl carrier protein